MIPPERFIIQARHKNDWLAARELGVTATTVAQAATDSGFKNLTESWDHPAWEGNEYTDFGNWAERYILEHAHRQHGILPSDWLIAGTDPTHLGTPDGLNLDHTLIAEAKTGGTIPKSVSREHRDQCLWNLHITEAERCLYLFQPRAIAADGSFYMALIEPVTFWVERDENRISELRAVAERVMEARERHQAQVRF